jgi:hypothetical protein
MRRRVQAGTGTAGFKPAGRLAVSFLAISCLASPLKS